MDRRAHWNGLYSTKGERDVSWFEELPRISLELLDEAGLTRDSCVIDVGGGDSHLVDALVARGLACVTVLDISHEAIRRAQERLGECARAVTWITADVTGDWEAP